MNYTIKPHPDSPEQVCNRTFEGDIGLQEIIDSWIDFSILLTRKPNVSGLINDLTKSSFKLNINDIRHLISFLNRQDYIRKLKIAVITNSPKTVTLPFMIMRKIKRIQIRVFESYSEAEKWVCEDLN